MFNLLIIKNLHMEEGFKGIRNAFDFFTKFEFLLIIFLEKSIIIMITISEVESLSQID